MQCTFWMNFLFKILNCWSMEDQYSWLSLLCKQQLNQKAWTRHNFAIGIKEVHAIQFFIQSYYWLAEAREMQSQVMPEYNIFHAETSFFRESIIWHTIASRNIILSIQFSSIIWHTICAIHIVHYHAALHICHRHCTVHTQLILPLHNMFRHFSTTVSSTETTERKGAENPVRRCALARRPPVHKRALAARRPPLVQVRLSRRPRREAAAELRWGTGRMRGTAELRMGTGGPRGQRRGSWSRCGMGIMLVQRSVEETAALEQAGVVGGGGGGTNSRDGREGRCHGIGVPWCVAGQGIRASVEGGFFAKRYGRLRGRAGTKLQNSPTPLHSL
jgi:hypothetical protein